MRRIFYIFLLVQFIIISCSINRNYKALSFFFDGVPEPSDRIVNTIPGVNDQVSENEDSLTIKIPHETRFYHQPYRLRGCDDCHLQSSVSEMKEQEPELCYQCHKNFDDTYKYIHGPVQGGFCTSCHSPHSSSEEALLLKPAEEICITCHNSGNLSIIPSHGLDNDKSCLECHNPHGGANNLMMRSNK